ncbi:MAG: class I adenylate-forming enzyme family protein [Sphingomonadales bacterium]
MTASPANFTDTIFEHARKHPKAIAVEDMTGRLTYKQFTDLIGRAGVWLKSLGVEPGQPVGVRLSNSTDHLILSLALMRVGAAKIEFSLADADGRLDAAIRQLGVTRLFVEPPARAIGDVECVSIGPGWRKGLSSHKGDVRNAGADPAPMDILLSSGSTGLAKGVPCTHDLILRRLSDWNPTYLKAGMTADDYSGTFLHVSSMSFTGFLVPLQARLMTGGKVVIFPEFAKLLDFVRAVREHDDAILIVTAGMCQDLLSCAPAEGLLFPKMRCMVSTGTPLPAGLKRRALASLTPHFTEIYGNSGAGVVSALFPEDIARHADSVGRVIPGLDAEIVDDDGRPVEPGQPGLLRCRGSGVAESLVAPDGRPGAEGIRDGWYYPGDLASIDAEGYLRLLGRSSDVVMRAGVRVFPTVMEMTLMSHPDVAEAAVVSVAQGESVHVAAAIQPRDGKDGTALHQYCIDTLGSEQSPDSIMFMASLPRTGGGKVDRSKVRERAALALARSGR